MVLLGRSKDERCSLKKLCQKGGVMKRKRRNSRQLRKDITRYISIMLLSGLLFIICILILLDTVAQYGFSRISLLAIILCGGGICFLGYFFLTAYVKLIETKKEVHDE